MSDDVVIVSAARTPVGSFNGAFATTPAHDLGAVAIKAALERAKLDPARVSEVIMGQILTAAQGQNPARQAAIAAGLPVETSAWGVNMLCGSGLRTVALGYLHAERLQRRIGLGAEAQRAAARHGLWRNRHRPKVVAEHALCGNLDCATSVRRTLFRHFRK